MRVAPRERESTSGLGARLRGGAAGFYRVLRANALSFIGFVLVVGILSLAVVVSVYPQAVVPYGATTQTGAYSLPPTILRWPPSWQHPFGTDGSGFDIYSEVLLALPLDVGIGVAIAGFALVVGGGLGLVAGFWDRPGTLGAIVATGILRTTDVFLAFPSLILGLAFVAAFGTGVWQVVVAVMLTWWPYYVRLVRGEVLAIQHLPYITAARAAGVRERRILVRHVLRNVLEPVVVYFTLDIGTVLVTFSAIAFVFPSAIPYPRPPEWGSMLSYYYGFYLISQYWWAIAFPSLAIFVTAFAFSLLGDGLRDVLDPRSRRALNPVLPVSGPDLPGFPSSGGTAPIASGPSEAPGPA